MEYRLELDGEEEKLVETTGIVQGLGSVIPYSYPCHHTRPRDLWCQRWAMSRPLHHKLAHQVQVTR